MAIINPPGKSEPRAEGDRESRRLAEPPTSQALWPTFMRRTIAPDPSPRAERRREQPGRRAG